MVKQHSDSQRRNLLPPLHRLLFYMHHPIDKIAHTTTFVTPVVEHWQERENSSMGSTIDRSSGPSHHERTLYHGATSRSKIKREDNSENSTTPRQNR